MGEKNTPPPRPKTSADNRDEYKPKHTRETNPYGVPIVEWDEDATGKYEGEELEAARAKRPTDVRVAILEKKHDASEKKSEQWQRMYVGLLEEIARRAATREETTFNTEINIKETDAKIRADEARDRLAARRARRKLIAQVVGIAAPAGAAVYELLKHWWL